MTIRAVVLGCLLALLISVATYFNDWVIGQTQLIGNHLPISVFGVAVLVLLGVNPLLGRLRSRLPLRAAELGVIVALGLAACGWPGSNFFRGFTTITAYPAHWLKTKANWQSANVMSYVPGGSAEFAQGHIQDWKRLGAELDRGRTLGPSTPAGRLWSLLPPSAQRSFAEGEQKGFDASRTADLTSALNGLLAEPGLYDQAAFGGVALPDRVRTLVDTPAKNLAPHELVRRNRWLLVAAFPGVFLPPPSGQGVVFDGGRADPFALDTLVQGRSKNQQLRVTELPWAKWWPTIRLWWGSALLLSFAALCMALVVHPQWYKRELLPYPVPRFVEEAAARKEGARLPDVARNKLFWIGFSCMVVWHLVNGLNAWFPEVPEIPRKFDFWAFAAVFRNAVRVWGSYGYFGPTVYASVVAFAFFLSSSVSFSLGIAEVLYMAFGAMLISYGIQMESGNNDCTGSHLMRFGSFAAVAVMIAYTGRRYYSNVISSAFGRARSPETPAYATWAARLGVVAVALTIGLLRTAGVGWGFAAAFVTLELVIFLVMSRMVAETGTFFMQASWPPVGILTAMLGFGAIGPTTYIALSVGTAILFIDSRELLMPYLVNGLKLVDRSDGPTPARLAPWIAAVIVVGLGVAGATTLYLQYNHGATQVGNTFGTDSLPLIAFDGLAQRIAAANADGTLGAATAVEGFGRLAAIKPDHNAPTWALLGLGLGFGAAVARLRWSWWPLHPIAFLVWGTYPIACFGPSFLLGWVIKAAVVGTTGARGYHQVKPLMVGVIAGELLSGLFWMLVGASYDLRRARRPSRIRSFRGRPVALCHLCHGTNRCTAAWLRAREAGCFSPCCGRATCSDEPTTRCRSRQAGVRTGAHPPMTRSSMAP